MNAREDWLAARRKGIGGTDMAVIIGLSPYKTPLELWLEKTGRAEQQHSPEAEERMYWGTALEDLVARRYAADTGRKVQRINDPLVHAGGVVRGNIDRAVINPDIAGRVHFKNGRLTTDRILECKTASAFALGSAEWGEPGTDEVPQHYWIQVQTYLGLAQCPVADLAVLFGGQKFATYTIEADPALFFDMAEQAGAWWQRHVVDDMPPEATTEDDARRLWKSHRDGKEKIVSSDVAEAVEKLAAIKEDIKALEEEEQAQRDIICTTFGDAEAISYMGQKLATWKQNKPGQKTDWKAVASALAGHIEPEIFALVRDQHTTETEGSRVLRLAKIKE